MEPLHSQVVDTIDEDFSLFDMQMAAIHRCTEFDYDVLSIIGTYLNVFVKTLAMASMLELGGQIHILFQSIFRMGACDRTSTFST